MGLSPKNCSSTTGSNMDFVGWLILLLYNQELDWTQESPLSECHWHKMVIWCCHLFSLKEPGILFVWAIFQFSSSIMSIANNESSETAINKEFVLASKTKCNTHEDVYRKFIFSLSGYRFKKNYTELKRKIPWPFTIKMRVQI